MWCAVVEEALRLRDQQETAKVRALVRGIGSEVAAEVSKMLAAMF